MTFPAIKVEGLWKEYAVGAARQHHTTFYDLLAHSLKAPFQRLRELGENRDETHRFWALSDVNFEVLPGEVLGIIGRNGAGKSTLLKILSRITAPTRGCVTLRGRMASLLEVGTGFHPELSGRENIFLNGALLGMPRADISRKFDAIVEFAEIHQFIDTPVKRYSSGMYVRLAFSVAAHLESDILIIDEVLAVGDAEFQKRCLGKMKEVSGSGRTVIFVSHNTTAIQTLCSSIVLLDHGKIDSVGNANVVIDRYLANMQQRLGLVHSDLKCLRLANVKAEYQLDEQNVCSIAVQLEFETSLPVPDLHIDFGLENQNGVRLLQIMPKMRGELPVSVPARSRFYYRVESVSTQLSPGEYFCTVYAQSKSLGILLHQSNIRLFRVSPGQAQQECMAPGFTSVLLPKYTAYILNKESESA